MISIIITLVVVGLLLYLIGLLPIDAQIMQIIRIVAIIAVVLWLVSVFFGGGLGFGHYGLAGPCR